MKDRELLVYGIIASAISAVMLFAALGDRQYGYYDLLRIVVTFSALLTAFIAYRFKSYIISTVSVIAAMVFNPVAKVALERSTWESIDIVAALYFLIICVVFYMQYKEPGTSK